MSKSVDNRPKKSVVLMRAKDKKRLMEEREREKFELWESDPRRCGEWIKPLIKKEEDE